MSAFSYQRLPFVLDSVLVPGASNEMSALLGEEGLTTTCFSPIYPPEYLWEIPLHAHFHGSSSLDTASAREVPLITCSEPSVAVKQYIDSSSMVIELEAGRQPARAVTTMEKKRKNIDSKVTREGKGKKQKNCDGTSKNTEENKMLSADREEKKKVLGESLTGYVHVRARRGQATDSHSLAERVRREKISERMKRLQSLVPGCDKITGKALILDEIINYVQSLQNQVEYLAAKLASINPMLIDSEVDVDANLLASEKLCALEPPLAYAPTPLGSFDETTPASTPFVFQQEQKFNVFSQHNGDPLWDMDEQTQNLVEQREFNYLRPF